MSRNLKVTRQLAALRQTLGAIRHLRKGELECAVTLSLAAEDQMPESEKPFLYKQLREAAPDLAKDRSFNIIRDWLKHFNEPDEIELRVFDVAIAVMRATSKFVAVYGQSHPEFEEFFEWCEAEGYKTKA